MIVATAGHIDHGKTALIRALTGVDTDRLPEEKQRGISIDLGFAYWPLEDGRLVGFVDVPGHERFVRNMLAGVCGIDFVLLVIAADDGVMPQTIEHLQILRLLEVTQGIAVITKTDCVPPARVDTVAAEARGLLDGTRLAGMAILPVSAITGDGLPALRQALQAAAIAHTQRQSHGQYFRLAVDRAFSIAGMGTVVTGTIFNGRVVPGDRLVLSPQGLEARVRGIQIRGLTVEQASAGSRCAINLASVERADVARGDWLLDPRIHAPTQRIDVEVSLLSTEARPLPDRAPVHLHLGTADVLARVAMQRGAPLGPGATAMAQLILATPVSALHGDRFILRDSAAQRTLGGGRVVDPFAPKGRWTSPVRRAAVVAMAHGDPASALAALFGIPERGVNLEQFEQAFNLRADAAAALYRDAHAVILGRERRFAIPLACAADLEQRVLACLAQLHRTQPQSSGMGIDALHDELASWLSQEAFLDVIRTLTTARRVEVAGSTVRLAGHDASFSPPDVVLWQRCLPGLLAGGASPPTLDQLAADLRVSPLTLADLVHRKRKSGEVFQATASRFYPRATLASLAAAAAAVAAASPDGQFIAAQFRDAIGTGRTLAIHILELFDRIGVTTRHGDQRRMRKDFTAIVGEAAPLVAPPR